MSREWKPGDVAIATWLGGGKVLAVRYDTGVERGWWLPLGTDRYHDDSDFADARPLVVIDPEDRESVERLAREYTLIHNYAGKAWEDREQHNRDFVVDSLAAALREFANPKPPRPDEPTGLGAVVEDGSVFTYTRFSHSEEHGEGDWINEDGARFRWADIPAVRILSEGVQP